MNSMAVDQIISKLKGLNLQVTSGYEVKNIMGGLGLTGVMGVDINPGRVIIRAVHDESPYSPVPRGREELISYIRDSKIIPRDNRASFEGESFFYGCICEKDIYQCRTQAVYEVFPIESPNSKSELDESYVTVGLWQVEKPFKVAAIAHHKDFFGKNEWMKLLHEPFLKFCSTYPEHEKDFLTIADFISSEFAKEVGEKERYNYRISAAYSKIATEFGFEGIMYPSAKGKGEGLCIAIPPNTVDRCLKWYEVLVFRVKTNKKHPKDLRLIHYLYSRELNPSGNFIWKDPHEYTESDAVYEDYLARNKEKFGVDNH